MLGYESSARTRRLLAAACTIWARAVAATSILWRRSSSLRSRVTVSRTAASNCTSSVSLPATSDSARETSSPNAEILCTTPSTVAPSAACRISLSRNRAASRPLASGDSRACSTCSWTSANSCCTSALLRLARTGAFTVLAGMTIPFRNGRLADLARRGASSAAPALRYDRNISTNWKNNLRVVMVSTRNPLNIGAAARAMANFGFPRLRVVSPYDVAFREARSAVGAAPLLQKAEDYATLASAIADCRLVVGTTSIGHRGLQHPMRRLEYGARLIKRALAQAPVALLFGSEKFGLSRSEERRGG